MASHQIPIALLLLTAAAAGPATAGLRYEAVTESRQQGSEQGAMRMVVEGWVDGEKAKVAFRESGNPILADGTYLLTQDGARTFYLVNPQEGTYARFDLDAMLGAMGAVMQNLGPMFQMQVSSPQVERLLEESGEAILGYSTTHTRFRTAYTMTMKVLGLGGASTVELVQDTWSTTAFADPGLGAWLRNEPRATGNPELDRLIRVEMAKVQGFPLKMEQVSTSTDGRGRRSVARTSQQVTALETTAVDAGLFALPAGFEEVSLLPVPGREGDDHPAMPLPKLFGGKKKKDG